jgi:hypothetical protein
MRASWQRCLIGLAVAFCAPQSAMAADNLTCASALLTEQVRADIYKAYRANEDIGEKANGLIGKKIAACMLMHDWSEAALESAMRYLFGGVLEDGLVREFTGKRKVSFDLLMKATDRYFGAIPEDEIRKFADGETSDDAVAQLIQFVLADRAVSPLEIQDDDVGRMIGEYAAARANVIYFRAAFARQ